MLGVMMAMAMATSPYEPDCGGNTGEIGACLAKAVEKAEQQMARYYDAAANRVRTDEYPIMPDAGVEAATYMEWAQASFVAHRDAECRAVYARFKEGTIRAIASLGCDLDMTNARTHDIWKRWLTFPDGSEPLLPEPVAVVAE